MTDSFFDHGQEKPESPGPANIPDLDNAAKSSEIPSEERRMAAIMAYIPFLCFWPLIQMRDDEFAYSHARQGLILFFLEIIAVLISVPFLVQIVRTTIIIGCLIGVVMGIMYALQGTWQKIPVIGDLANRILK